jgi:hypothetical protein
MVIRICLLQLGGTGLMLATNCVRELRNRTFVSVITMNLASPNTEELQLLYLTNTVLGILILRHGLIDEV